MQFLRWLFSRTVRKAGELSDSVEKILNHQRDILSADRLERVEGALKEMKRVVGAGAAKAAIQAQMDVLEETANKWLKPYPNGDFREYAVMFLEIAVLILGSRQFLVQPMVIPTGSAQPTLWGITYQDLRDQPGVHNLTAWKRTQPTRDSTKPAACWTGATTALMPWARRWA